MPVGTSTGELYEDQFDFQTKSPLATNYLSQAKDLASLGEGVVPKEGQTPPVPNMDLRQQNRLMAEPFIPDSLKPDDRPLQNLPDEPGKIPEVQTDPGMSLAKGVSEAAGFLPVGGTSSKAIFLGLGGMRRLLGEGQTTRLLNKAFDILQTTDKPLPEVLAKTGISVGADKQLRYEITDVASKLEKNLPDVVSLPTDKPTTLKELLPDHPELYKAHPDIGRIPVYGAKPKEGSAYRESTDEMFLETGLPKEVAVPFLLHEIQHAIQAREGFARGGNVNAFLPEGFNQFKEFLSDSMREKAVDKAKLQYMRMAGEQEAYNVENRLDLTAAERREILPYKTETSPREKQIIIKTPARKYPNR